jgi:PTH1 family peptidyl-tRNA hydrolase
MKLLVGLGNPGKKYANTRHNLGFKVLEELADRYRIEQEKNRFDSIVGHIKINNEKVILLKPLTFMNLSGKAVQAVVRWFKIVPANILVIYDDMDIPVGKLRIRAEGSGGGHKGMLSIIQSLGTKDLARIRIGIGRPADSNIEWVLGEFTKEEQEVIRPVLLKAADAVEVWVKSGIDVTMNEYN